MGHPWMIQGRRKVLKIGCIGIAYGQKKSVQMHINAHWVPPFTPNDISSKIFQPPSLLIKNSLKWKGFSWNEKDFLQMKRIHLCNIFFLSNEKDSL